MRRELSCLAVIILLVALAGRASGVDLIVPSGSTVTKNTAESFGYFMVAGRLNVEAGANLTFSSESHIDGVETSGIRPEIIMNGGSFLINARTNMGTVKVGNGGNYAYLTMNGGTFTCTGTFKFPDDGGGEHRIYLNGGIMHSHDIEQKHDRDAVIYVGAGILRLDDTTCLDCDPQDWKDNGDLLPVEGYDDVVIEYVPAGPYTEVRAIGYDANIASDPNPPDWGAVLDTEVTLSWTPGENAAKHDVYFGTDFNDVNNANDPNVLPGRGRQDANTYDVCDLELGKPYYWRIDEVNGLTKWRGAEPWRFTVVDGFVNSLGMLFISIQPGTFQMGSDGGEWDEKPVHQVTISEPFYVMEREVTADEYGNFDANYSGSDPVTGISWHDANAFCQWLSNLEARTYRLPTEAEWEHVCRAGTTTPYWSGGSRPAPGSANPWGVVNLHNPPREWVWDWHGQYPHQDQVDPVGPELGFARVIRGGGLDNNENYYARSANRAGLGPGFGGGSHDISFRVVLADWPGTAPRAFQAPFARQGIRQNTGLVEEGPDQYEPYFNQRPMIPTPPEYNASREAIDAAGFHPAFRGHNHSPGLEVCPNGDVLMIIYTSYSEYEEGVSLMAARLRFGSNQWGMPSYMFDFPGTNDHAPMLWNDDGTLHFFWGCPRLSGADPYPFQWTSSTDSGATWSEVKFPKFVGPIGGHSRQPINSALRDDYGTLYVSSDGSGGESVLWKSDNNGLSWYDPGGRTYGRHTTFVLLDGDDILGMGGKNTQYGSTKYMPKSISDNGAVSWTESVTPFSYLDGNQRPCVIRLESDNLFFCSDFQYRGSCDQPAAITEYGSLAALSDDEGETWLIKKIPTALPHECLCWDCGNVGTLGYSVARQAPNGIIHVISTMNRPCQHFEMNEDWIEDETAGGNLPPDPGETGTVNQYQEDYPGGATKTTWGAKICDDGRYLLHGTETWYYENGTKQYEATYYNGNKVGDETYSGPDSVKQWSWDHNEPENRSVWAQWWPNGLKRIESRWRYGGMVAHGDSHFWDMCGQPEAAYNFNDGSLTGSAPLPPAQVKDADLHDDDFIDYSDVRVLVDNWLISGPAGYNTADLNCDGEVELDDFSVLALKWLQSCP